MEYKASYQGKKGFCDTNQNEFVFSPKNDKYQEVRIPYANIARVNPTNPLVIVFKVITFPIVVLWYALLLFTRTSYYSGSGSSNLKIYTKDGKVYQFRMGSHAKNRLGNEIKSKISSNPSATPAPATPAQ